MSGPKEDACGYRGEEVAQAIKMGDFFLLLVSEFGIGLEFETNGDEALLCF